MPTRHPPVEGSWSAGPSPVARRLAVPLREFLDIEAAAGLVLLAAAVALGWANPPSSLGYGVGILTGSLLAAGRGALLLHRSLPRPATSTGGLGSEGR